MAKANTPSSVTKAIKKLVEGNKEGIAEAHSLLQEAVLGELGCLRNELPLKHEWAQNVWLELGDLLKHENNHVRSIAGQMVSNLSISVRVQSALDGLRQALNVTYDEKFVTARHVLQSIWKFGLGEKQVRNQLLDRYAERFEQCGDERNYTLIRYDILVGLRRLYDATKLDEVRSVAETLVRFEKDNKYRKKYAGVWKDISKC